MACRIAEDRGSVKHVALCWWKLDSVGWAYWLRAPPTHWSKYQTLHLMTPASSCPVCNTSSRVADQWAFREIVFGRQKPGPRCLLSLLDYFDDRAVDVFVLITCWLWWHQCWYCLLSLLNYFDDIVVGIVCYHYLITLISSLCSHLLRWAKFVSMAGFTPGWVYSN